MLKTGIDSIQKQSLKTSLNQCREGTLRLFDRINHDTFCQQAHADFSPVGWHLGHIAYTESYWILGKCAGLPSIRSEYDRLFAADSLPKAERANLPPLADVVDYLNLIRDRVFDYLDTAPLDRQAKLWHWLIQHESQHCETITFVLAIVKLNNQSRTEPEIWGKTHPIVHAPIQIPSGYFEQGCDSIDALDNESPKHQVYLDTYEIDRYPVTRGQFRKFIEAGGYIDRRLWSEHGWQWLNAGESIQQPLYWDAWNVGDDHPVCGVSWDEAEAYARFVGMRLPTEAEWEKAASWGDRDCRVDRSFCNFDRQIGMTTPVTNYPDGKSLYGCLDLLGNVWEWTSTRFYPYLGFDSFPYAGYSSNYFDRKHFVLRGGSWATRPWALRNSWRNWYHPHVRQIFAGFRCAR